MKVCNYYHLMARHSNKLLTIQVDKIVQRIYDDPINQTWLFIPSDEENYYFIISKGTGKCLTYCGVDTLLMKNIDNTDSQKWMFKDSNDNFLFIKNKKNNECLDVDGMLMGDNVAIITYRYKPRKNENQQWKLLDLIC